MKAILAALDFSPATSRVLDEAAQLARAVDAQVVLLHVLRFAAPAAGPAPDVSGLALLNAGLRAEAEQRLAEAKERLRAAGVDAQTLVVEGSPVGEILVQASRLGADRIVLGSHGHSALYDLVVGSTTAGVIKSALCPVVVVPADWRQGVAGGAGEGIPRHVEPPGFFEDEGQRRP